MEVMEVDLGCEVAPLVVRETSAISATCFGIEQQHILIEERQQSLFLRQTCPTAEL